MKPECEPQSPQITTQTGTDPHGPGEEKNSVGLNEQVQFHTPINAGPLKRVLELREGRKVTPFSIHKSPAPRPTPPSKIYQIPPSPMMTKLGYGTGVGVYLLQRSPNSITGQIRSPWAIKKLIDAKTKDQKSRSKLYASRLEYEAEILRNLSHPNVVGYRGFNPKDSVLLMEKASTSLNDLIEIQLEETSGQGAEGSPFSPKFISKVALDIAKALDYLHIQKQMIHGDLKSGNVLVFGDWEIVKLTDFGVARKLKENGEVDGEYVGTDIWNPMEVILAQRGTPKYLITSKADIYPYALTLWEMLSLQPPHFPASSDLDLDETSGEMDSSYNSFEGSTMDLDDTENSSFGDDISYGFEQALQESMGTRPPLPPFEFDNSYNEILSLFYCCTEEDPSARPTAKDIISLFNSAKS